MGHARIGLFRYLVRSFIKDWGRSDDDMGILCPENIARLPADGWKLRLSI